MSLGGFLRLCRSQLQSRCPGVCRAAWASQCLGEAAGLLLLIPYGQKHSVSFFIYIRLKAHENLLKKTGKSKKMRSSKEEDLLVEQTLMEGQKRILRLRSFR